MNAETPREFGEELRRERELREVSREQLAEVTKVSGRHIEALETGRFDQLPARVFARGFVRAIAIHLGLDPERTAAAFSHVHENWANADAARREEQPLTGAVPRLSRPRRAVSLNTTVLGLTVAAVLALLTGAAALWKSRSGESRSASARRPGPQAQREPATGPASLSLPPAIAAATVALAPTAPSAPIETRERPAVGSPVRSEPAGPPVVAAGAPAAASASGRTLTLTFRDDCWTEVSIDGRVAVAELCRRGSVREFSGAKKFVLTLGNAGGVDVALDGRAIPALGQVGQVVRNLVLDESGREARPEGS